MSGKDDESGSRESSNGMGDYRALSGYSNESDEPGRLYSTESTDEPGRLYSSMSYDATPKALPASSSLDEDALWAVLEERVDQVVAIYR